jgi:hypothetical protein
LLDKYSQHLTQSGVFIVRLYLSDRSGKIKFRVKKKVDLIKSSFEVVEERQYPDAASSTVLVFRPRRQN